MHVVELQRLVQKLLSPFGSIGVLIGKIISKLVNYFDKIVFILFYRSSHKYNNSIEKETEKLLYSWERFSNNYLKYNHGQDYDHPSRSKAYEIIEDICENVTHNGYMPTLLEIPAGMGTDAEYYFSKQKLKYTGMELNPKQLEVNKERLPQIDFEEGNILDIDKPDNSFDIVYSRHIFEHLSLSAMETAINETIRVAKKAVVYVFFRMENIPDHLVRPVRVYHYNTLSKDKILSFIESIEKVDNVKATFIEGRVRGENNWIFVISLKS